MKRSFPKLLSAIACTLFLGVVSCTENPDNLEPIACPVEETVQPQTTTRSLEGAVYHELTDSWMVPQKDPYTLENFQRAYDNLIFGKSTRALTRSQTALFSDAQPLRPTHYSLKIYPRNETEQWKVELMEDVNVAYTPFDYVQLTEAETAELSTDTRSAAVIYPEDNRYTITYDNLQSLEGPMPSVTYTMPVLYTVWPIDKPLPADLDYEIDYPVFLPPYDSAGIRSSETSLSPAALQLLEYEAISLALGRPAHIETRASSDPVQYFSGQITFYDETYKMKFPQPNLIQGFQYGTKIWETYTRISVTPPYSYGGFSITAPIPYEAQYYHKFEHPRWKITSDKNTIPTKYVIGPMADYWYEMISGSFNMSFKSQTSDYIINPGLDYFFNREHEVPVSNYPNGIRIVASRDDSPGSGGYFEWNENPAYIVIKNNYNNNTSYKIGGILHELGHFMQFLYTGGRDNMARIPSLLTESYACYVGWYVGECYYRSLGIAKMDDSFQYTNAQDRQDWKKTNTGYNANYSPLFVDLIDTYDQSILKPYTYRDEISGFPHAEINRIAKDCRDWNSTRAALEKQIAIPMNPVALRIFEWFIEPYDYWFANNPGLNDK